MGGRADRWDATHRRKVGADVLLARRCNVSWKVLETVFGRGRMQLGRCADEAANETKSRLNETSALLSLESRRAIDRVMTEQSEHTTVSPPLCCGNCPLWLRDKRPDVGDKGVCRLLPPIGGAQAVTSADGLCSFHPVLVASGQNTLANLIVNALKAPPSGRVHRRKRN
jgi:hypothetical protein